MNMGKDWYKLGVILELGGFFRVILSYRDGLVCCYLEVFVIGLGRDDWRWVLGSCSMFVGFF